MPFFKDSLSYGNLYLKFQVQFPKRGEISESQAEELSKVIFILIIKIL
jgi:DnaJ-class molecular chaperone